MRSLDLTDMIEEFAPAKARKTAIGHVLSSMCDDSHLRQSQNIQKYLLQNSRHSLQESVFAYTALCLAINTRASDRIDDKPDWKRPRGSSRHM